MTKKRRKRLMMNKETLIIKTELATLTKKIPMNF